MATSNINYTVINTAVTNALRSVTAYAAAVESLKAALVGVERKDAQEVVTPSIAKFYGVSVVASSTTGLRTFDKTAQNYEAAKKARTRLLAAVYGGSTSAHSEPAVKRFETQRVDMIQNALVGLSKAQAKAYLAKALERAFS